MARLTRIAIGTSDVDARNRLIAEGTLRAGSGNASSILDQAPLELPVSIKDALDQDRADRL